MTRRTLPGVMALPAYSTAASLSAILRVSTLSPDAASKIICCCPAAVRSVSEVSTCEVGTSFSISDGTRRVCTPALMAAASGLTP